MLKAEWTEGCPHKSVVRPVLGSPHSSSDAHILDIPPSYNGEVDHVPLVAVFGP